MIEKIPGIIDSPLVVNNCDGEDTDDEWFLPDFGRDEDYHTAFGIYRKHRDGYGFPYSGGWAEQLATHIEIIDLFGALDANIERPKVGNS